MSVVIRTENLGKKYIIGHQKQGSYLTLRDSLSHAGREMWQAIRHPFSPNREKTDVEEFWALKDVDLEIKEGDRVGIIGRNGAGKSTLLKILSRITEPTTGRVSIKGRVASLLEVGTGFHPELTGRENIFLNGAILGMTRYEIRRKFDEIVAFAEVEKFLDTPVKRYSSGMYVRLAFAVAAHLEPEILLVDEVLAVGDAQFQKKCLGKMGEVTKDSRTILFVSHNLGAIKSLCKTALLLSNGQLEYSGNVGEVIDMYIRDFENNTLASDNILANNYQLGLILNGISLYNDRGETVSALQTGQFGMIGISIGLSKPHKRIHASIAVNSIDGTRVCIFHSKISGSTMDAFPPGGTLYCVLKKIPFIPGDYNLHVKIIINENEEALYVPYAAKMKIENGDFFGTQNLPDKNWAGTILVQHEWHMDR